MLKRQYNWCMLLLIGVGFLASLWIGFQRYQVEDNAHQVEIAVEFHDLEDLAYQEGYDVEVLLGRVKEAGATTLVVEEASLERLVRRGWASLHRGGELIADEKAGLLSDAGWRHAIQTGQIEPEWFYLTFSQSTLAEEFTENAKHKIGEERVRSFKIGTASVVGIRMWTPEKIMEASFGLFKVDLDRAEKAGYLLSVRPTNGNKPDASYNQYLIGKLSGRQNLTSLIISGMEMIGYRHDRGMDDQPYMQEFGLWMKENQVRLGMVENASQLQFLDQAGLFPLATDLDYEVARVYTIYKEELKKLTRPVATDRWPLAIKERNIKIALIRKFEKLEGEATLIDTHLGYVASVTEGIKKEGYTLGKAEIMEPYHAPVWGLIVVMSGIIAAGIFFLSQIRPFSGKKQLVLWGIGFVFYALPLGLTDSILLRQIGALGAACLFAPLGISIMMDYWHRWPGKAKFGLTATCLRAVMLLFFAGTIVMIGASMMAALLSDIRFFLEMEIFRGVKLTFVLPIILTAFVYVARFSLTGNPDGQLVEEIKRILKSPATIQLLAIGFIGMIGVYVLLGRSGHSAGFGVPGWEMKLRSFLETVFFTRPRSKELFLGHPAMVVATYFWAIRSPRWLHFGAVIVGSIGLASMIETFAHVRSPLFLSYVRGFDGVWSGAILGIVGILMIHVLLKIYKAWRRWEESHD